MKLIKKTILLIIIVIISIILKNNLFHITFAYSYDLEESTLFYENNKTELEKKIKMYLENIDDLLIVNSSFDFSDTLTQNYDFLVHFAIDYILKYQESYHTKIKILDNYSYITKEGIKKTNNQYVSLEEIYNITNKYFGIKDFKIINENIKTIDNYISLTDYTEVNFPLIIENISVEIQTDQVLATINYDMNTSYLYTFQNQNNVLKIKNIEVLS